jgi:hypothetical protein
MVAVELEKRRRSCMNDDDDDDEGVNNNDGEMIKGNKNTLDAVLLSSRPPLEE